MKFLFVLALATVASAIDWSWCGDDTYKAHVDTVTSKPDPPQKATNNTIAGVGATDVAVSGGTYEISLKVDGIKLLDKKGDFCKPSSITLPLGSGSMYFPGLPCPATSGQAITLNIFVSLNKSAPKGKTETVLKATSTDGTPLLCVDVKFDIPRGESLNFTASN